ncbi:HAD family hydrolase [Agrococcus sp. SGAir0287]|uniref:HAD family hydrolase n=1 Tax=Agrococcus sp. SGAir0287 TaxID=2070347 RepID=UPI0010CD2913|nr:HAD family hydrolase [Agrococcus sp. SGAir0287]QCR18410.1 haloacid dehalogenase [Agrococcus sp. SGAir0287]
MTDRWLVALDIDGTTVREDDSLSARVAEAVRAVVDAGHLVVLATGRSQSTTESLAERVGIRPEWMVVANGALVLQREGDAYVREHVETFDAGPALRRIVQGLPEARFLVEDATGFRRYTRGMDDWNLDHAEEVEFDGLTVEPAMRVVVMSPDHAVEDFLEIVEGMGLHKVSYAIGFSSWLDIAPDGVNKATGLQRVLDATGIPRERVLAVGDGRNDIDMLAWTAAGGGRAIAMGQAPDEVAAAANERTGTVDEDGLADVLEPLAAVGSVTR